MPFRVLAMHRRPQADSVAEASQVYGKLKLAETMLVKEFHGELSTV